jgi:hypothetical protein
MTGGRRASHQSSDEGFVFVLTLTEYRSGLPRTVTVDGLSQFEETIFTRLPSGASFTTCAPLQR